MQRVLWVDLLNLLALEGPSGDRVRAALDSSGAAVHERALQDNTQREHAKLPQRPSIRLLCSISSVFAAHDRLGGGANSSCQHPFLPPKHLSCDVVSLVLPCPAQMCGQPTGARGTTSSCQPAAPRPAVWLACSPAPMPRALRCPPSWHRPLRQQRGLWCRLRRRWHPNRRRYQQLWRV